MKRILAGILLALVSLPVAAAEYMEKTPFQLSRAFSPGVILADMQLEEGGVGEAEPA